VATLKWFPALYYVARAANESQSGFEAITRAIDVLAARLGLDAGVAWLERPDSKGGLRLARTGKAAFPESWATHVIRKGDGLTGRVLKTARPSWSNDLPSSLGSRAPSVSELGWSSAVALPITIESRVAGVLEFFGHEPVVEHEGLESFLTEVGRQVAVAMARDRRLAAIHRNSLRQRDVTAQELHDGLGRELTGLGFLARNLAEELKRSPRAARKASKFAAGLRRAVERVRAISRGLMPVDIDAMGLRAALDRLAEESHELYGIPCRLECRGEALCRDREAAIHLFHIAQEAATNAAKHAGAKHLVIRVEGEDRSIRLSIEDDGRGFTPGNRVEGSGLRIMRYRAGLIGARLSVKSRPGGGTRVSCTSVER
jgi:signal transduction histidine kinase